MANAGNLDKFVEANFILLADYSDEEHVELTDEVSEEEIQRVNQIILDNQAQQSIEKADSSDEFEDNPKTV